MKVTGATTLALATALGAIAVLVFAQGRALSALYSTLSIGPADATAKLSLRRVTAGFLLRRTVLSDVSEIPPRMNGRGPLQRYDRLVLVIVDALRYDFVAWQLRGAGDPPAAPYANRLASIHDALTTARPDGSRPAALYRFEV